MAEALAGSGSGNSPRVALLILDGWGLREPAGDNAVTLANTPNWDRLWASGNYPRAQLQTCGRAVGLPAGQMGNSEVGHLNLGAGRVVKQSLLRIQEAIDSGVFSSNEALGSLIRGVRERNAALHLMGLIGPGGVHAVDAHLLALCELAEREQIPAVRVHVFLDGRDTPPQSALGYLTELVGRSGQAGGAAMGGGCKVATLMGRYWAMDRDRRWERTERAYRAIVLGEGERVHDPVQAIADAYEAGETDEFIEPRVVVDEDGEPAGLLRDGDGVIFFNFRADRARQLTRALAEHGFSNFDRGAAPPRAELVTMMQYDEDFPLPVIFQPQKHRNILKDVLADHGRRSFRTAETEKYPHVTYFFNGGVEEIPAGEEREMVPSPRVATYNLQPEMSAAAVTGALERAIDSQRFDFLLCNFANPDMVGHTGVLDAAVAAVETVDRALGTILDACKRSGTVLLVTADHGNCEQMWDPVTNGPHTAHTTNPVGIVLVEPQERKTAFRLQDGALCDVAPTILALLRLPQPEEMTGRDLRVVSS